jgi:transposase/5-methylcytosine-specific restriction endonuclease McrA
MECMDRTTLEQMLSQGFSLAEIGRRVGKHESTVGYWIEKHGLCAVGKGRYAPKGGLCREDLETLVADGASLTQIADALGRSTATVRHWLIKHGLRTQRPRGAPRRPGAQQARAAGLKEATVVCPLHGAVEHVLDKRGSYRCRRCRADAVVRRRRKVKETLVAEAGGCCQLCGYERCVAALQFHHLDPRTKAFGVARRGAHSIEKLRLEVRKCVLLCSNCHAEVEDGMARFPVGLQSR